MESVFGRTDAGWVRMMVYAGGKGPSLSARRYGDRAVLEAKDKGPQRLDRGVSQLASPS